MNTRAKGNRNRLKTIKLLESYGYDVAIIERTGRFIFPKDAYGLFDLLAIPKDTRDPILVQVSTNKPHPHKHFKKFVKDHPSRIVVVQYCWIDNTKEPKTWRY